LGSPQAQIAISLLLVAEADTGLVNFAKLFDDTISLNYYSKSEPLAGTLLVRGGALFAFLASSMYLAVNSASFRIRNYFVKSFLFLTPCSFMKFLSILIFS